MGEKTQSIRKRFISFLPALIVMLLIFAFSCQNSDQSGAESTKIAEILLTAVGKVIPYIRNHIGEIDFELVEHIIRKIAHGTEYAVLGACLSYHFHTVGGATRGIFTKAVLTGACYAASDEFHQLFVPGRSGQFSDVCIDTAGVVAGTLIFLWVRKHNAERKSEKHKQKK